LSRGNHEERFWMILISLMLAATTPPAVKPDSASPGKAVPARRARVVTRSKRLIELEAVVRSLGPSPAERVRGAGPEGL
jgi:hypothetical protein